MAVEEEAEYNEDASYRRAAFAHFTPIYYERRLFAWHEKADPIAIKGLEQAIEREDIVGSRLGIPTVAARYDSEKEFIFLPRRNSSEKIGDRKYHVKFTVKTDYFDQRRRIKSHGLIIPSCNLIVDVASSPRLPDDFVNGGLIEYCIDRAIQHNAYSIVRYLRNGGLPECLPTSGVPDMFIPQIPPLIEMLRANRTK